MPPEIVLYHMRNVHHTNKPPPSSIKAARFTLGVKHYQTSSNQIFRTQTKYNTATPSVYKFR